MKRHSKLKQNKNWVIKEINLNNKKQGKVIERGEYEGVLNNPSINTSYIATYQSTGYHSKKLVVKLQLNVIHHSNGYYNCYQIIMITDYYKRFEMLESGLSKIMYEINSNHPFYEDHTLLKESHQYAN